MPFDGRVSLLQDPDNPSLYRTLGDVAWAGSHGDMITVPAGYRTDLASVPRFLTWFIPDHGAYSIAAIVHDWLCEIAVPGGMVTRRDADGMFGVMLGELGVPRIQRRLMWAGVRAASRWSDATATERWRLLSWSMFAVLLIGAPTLVVGVWLAALRLGSKIIARAYPARKATP